MMIVERTEQNGRQFGDFRVHSDDPVEAFFFQSWNNSKSYHGDDKS